MPDSILILQEQLGEPDFATIELERAGYTVVSVAKLWVAIAWLRVNDPLLIIAPVHLADDDVFELLRFVRSDFHLRETKILLSCLSPSPFTTGMRSTISSAAKAMGANAVLIADGAESSGFNRMAFWEIVAPLLAVEKNNETLAQEQTIPPGD